MTEKTKEQIVEETLSASKDFTDLVVLGYDKDNSLHIKTTVTNFPFIHYTLNTALFEVILAEKNMLMNKEKDGKVEG